jgi:hypothetical protein
MSRGVPLCPSADVDSRDAVVIGVVLGSATAPRVKPLERPVPVSDAIIASTAPLPPTRILRIAAACQDEGCRHFADDRCAFAAKVVRMLPTVTDTLPPCAIRARCRWFAEERAAACLRCPQVVRENPALSRGMAMAGNPLAPVPDRPATGVGASPSATQELSGEPDAAVRDRRSGLDRVRSRSGK